MHAYSCHRSQTTESVHLDGKLSLSPSCRVRSMLSSTCRFSPPRSWWSCLGIRLPDSLSVDPCQLLRCSIKKQWTCSPRNAQPLCPCSLQMGLNLCLHASLLQLLYGSSNFPSFIIYVLWSLPCSVRFLPPHLAYCLSLLPQLWKNRGHLYHHCRSTVRNLLTRLCFRRRHRLH